MSKFIKRVDREPSHFVVTGKDLRKYRAYKLELVELMVYGGLPYKVQAKMLQELRLVEGFLKAEHKQREMSTKLFNF